MNVISDNLNCYIEGIKIPISGIDIFFSRNSLKQATIKLALGQIIIPHLWANAFIQVTYIKSNKEKLFFQGLIKELNIIDTEGYISIVADSEWKSMNLNSTLDYVAPKKYGIQNIEEELTIYLGNEETIKTDNTDVENYHLSERYFFISPYKLDDPNSIGLNDDEAFKLQFIADRTPFASLFAFSLFEDIAYKNFFLTKAYVDRFNLLKKVSGKSRRTNFDKLRTESIEASERFTDLDVTRSGLAYKQAKFTKDVSVTGAGETPFAQLSLVGINANLPYIPFTQKAKELLENSSFVKNVNNTKAYKDKTGFVGVDKILTTYDIYAKQMNVDPNLLLAQSYHESAGFNPYAQSNTGAAGWAQFVAGTWIEVTGRPLDDRFNIIISIQAQCKYMNQMFQSANGSWQRALSNYVDGPNATNRPQTPKYIESVSGIYKRLFK